MRYAIQNRYSPLPSLRVAVTAALLSAAIALLGLAATSTRVATSQDDVLTVPVNGVPFDAARWAANAPPSTAADGAAKSLQRWQSDVMDSHESIPSLAALTESANAKGKLVLR